MLDTSPLIAILAKEPGSELYLGAVRRIPAASFFKLSARPASVCGRGLQPDRSRLRATQVNPIPANPCHPWDGHPSGLRSGTTSKAAHSGAKRIARSNLGLSRSWSRIRRGDLPFLIETEFRVSRRPRQLETPWSVFRAVGLLDVSEE